MADINFLPTELKKKEDRERKRKRTGAQLSVYVPENLEPGGDKEKGASKFHDAIDALKSIKLTESGMRASLDNKVNEQTHLRAESGKDGEQSAEKMVNVNLRIPDDNRKERIHQAGARDSWTSRMRSRLGKVFTTQSETRILNERLAYQNPQVSVSRDTVAMPEIAKQMPVPASKEMIVSESSVDKKEKKEEKAETKKPEASLGMAQPAVEEAGGETELIEVNLLPAEKAMQARIRTRVYILSASVAVVVCAVALGWAGLSYQKRLAEREIEQMDGQIAEIERQIASTRDVYAERKLDLTRLEAVTDILEERFVWTSFFDHIESLILPSASVQAIEIDEERVSMRIQSNSWEAAAQQLAIFEDAKELWDVANVSASEREQSEENRAEFEEGETREENFIGFVMELKLKKSAWR